MYTRGLALAAFLVATSAAAQTPPFTVGGDPRVDPSDFRVTIFASGLDSPLSMQALSDGSLLVGTNAGLLRLLDSDGDGVAEGPGSYLYTASGGLVTSLRLAGNLAFVAQGQTISILRRGVSPAAPLTLLTSILIQIPFPWSHISFTLAVRQTDTNLFELFFNVGSKEHDQATSSNVPVSGAITGVVSPDSIYRVVVDDRGPAVVVTGLERIAAGLRNAFGIAFHPATGDLYFEDNSIDGPVSPFEVSADEEQEHADRILQLGGEPNFSPEGLLSRSHSEYVEGDELVDMIKEDLVAERVAIDSYREMVEYFTAFDTTTRKMLEEIQASEEQHADDLAELLENLPKQPSV